jgi:hypothetical protein
MSPLVPQIGAKGLYKLLAPFDTLLLDGVPYKCAEVRKLSGIVAAGGNPELDYYKPHGIDTTKYLSDASNGVCIITLQTNTGITVYVPNSYIDGLPDIGGIIYTTLALAIKVGAVPETLNLTALRNQIKSDVLEFVGVEAEVNTVMISQPVTIRDSDHTVLEAARMQKKGTVVTDRAKLIEALRERDNARSKIVELETYIRSLPRP